MTFEIIASDLVEPCALELAAVREALEAWGDRRLHRSRALLLLVPRRRGLGVRLAGAREAHHWHRAPRHLVLGFDLDPLGDQAAAAEALARVVRAHERRGTVGLAAWEHLPLTQTLHRRDLAALRDPHATPWQASDLRPSSGLRVVGWWEHRSDPPGSTQGLRAGEAGVYCVCPVGHRVALGWRREGLRFEPGDELSVPCPGC